MKQKQYGITAKFKMLMNNINLGKDFYIWVLLSGILGGIAFLVMGIIFFGDSTPLKSNLLYLYLESFWGFGDTILYKNTELLKSVVQTKLQPKLIETMSYYSVFFGIGAVISATAITFVTLFLAEKSAKTLQDQHIRGTDIITEDQLEKDQLLKKLIGYSITGKIMLSREHETKHTLIVGGTGAGKTVLLKRLIRSQMKHPSNSKAKFIIHDVKGDWVRQFYNADYDLIYNMSDKRSIVFNIFNYINDITELKSIVATLIARSPDEKEPIWTDSARGILEGILVYSIATDQKTLQNVKEMITWKPNKLRKELMKVTGTEIGVQYLSASETQVANYMSNFVSKVKFFEALSDSCHGKKENFDLESWLKSDKQSKIFMVNNVKDMELNAPRIAVFVDTLIKIVLDFEESKERRIYLYLDELGAANKIDSLEKGIILGRSYGLSIIVGIQEIAKFDKIYGEHDRKTIINNLSSKIILRLQDPDTAEYLAKNIGEKEYTETDQSASIGTESNRDGIGFNKKVKKEMAILASQVMDLNDLEFYFKQPEQLWTHVQAEFIPKIDILENKNEAFIKCSGLGLNFKVKEGSDIDMSNSNPTETVEEKRPVTNDQRRRTFGKIE